MPGEQPSLTPEETEVIKRAVKDLTDPLSAVYKDIRGTLNEFIGHRLTDDLREHLEQKVLDVLARHEMTAVNVSVVYSGSDVSIEIRGMRSDDTYG